MSTMPPAAGAMPDASARRSQIEKAQRDLRVAITSSGTRDAEDTMESIDALIEMMLADEEGRL